MPKSFTINLDELSAEPDEKIVVMPIIQDDIGPHDHQFYEFAYVTGGTAKHVLNGVEYTIQQGDYFFIDYGSRHSYQVGPGFGLINCLFLPEALDESLRDCYSFEELIQVCLLKYHKWYLGKNSVNRIFHDRGGRIFRLLDGLAFEYREKKIGYDEIFRFRMLEILILTMREVVETGGRMVQSAPIRDLMRYAQRNYREPSLLQRFCGEYHFSPQYISRLFKEETGVNVTQYVQQIRIGKCCEMLSGSDLPIAEIAREIGYTDMKFFNVVFKRIRKVSPREYRKSVRT